MATAIIGFLADPGGYPGLAMSAMAAVVGGLQIANISKQEVEGYYEGGYTNGDRVYRAGEKGLVEFISPNWMVRDPLAGPIINDLNNYRLGKKTKFIDPDFESINNSFKNTNASTTQSSVQDNQAVVLEIKTLNKEIKTLTSYLSDPNNRRAFMSIDDFRKTTKRTGYGRKAGKLRI